MLLTEQNRTDNFVRFCVCSCRRLQKTGCFEFKRLCFWRIASEYLSGSAPPWKLPGFVRRVTRWPPLVAQGDRGCGLRISRSERSAVKEKTAVDLPPGNCCSGVGTQATLFSSVPRPRVSTERPQFVLGPHPLRDPPRIRTLGGWAPRPRLGS